MFYWKTNYQIMTVQLQMGSNTCNMKENISTYGYIYVLTTVVLEYFNQHWATFVEHINLCVGANGFST